jgi:hypothetical protein
MTTFRPRRVRRRDGRGRLRLDRVGHGQHPGRAAVDGDQDRSAALPGQIRHDPLGAREIDAGIGEQRRIGALSLGQGIWTVPDVPAFADGIQRAIELAERGDGDVVLLDATGRNDRDADHLVSLFNDARRDEWNEFVADCAKFEAEIDKELAANKLTLAELEEEEQSLERLRRWYRELKTRDVFGSQHATGAEQRLTNCVERLEDYTEQVFAALHQM